MRLTRTILGLTAAACFTLTPAYADRGHSSASKPTTVAGKPTTTNPTRDLTTNGGKSAAGQSTHTASKSKSTGTKSASKSNTTTVSTTGTRITKTQTKSSTKSSSTGTSTKMSTSTKTSTTSTTAGPKKKGTTTTTSTSGASTQTPPMNPVAAKISSKPKLDAKVSAMLPNGMLLNDASAGFKNQGQFIAALHVSQNLGIPFADLKKQMVTTTGTGAAATSTQTKSLGQAIQDLKHTSSSTASTQATRAEHEADNDVKSTTTTSSTQKKVKHHTESEHESGDRDDDREHHDADHESRKDSHKEKEHEHQSVAQQISRNQQLKVRVQALLPAGMPLSDAARGFKSESQFLAALHASKDLGIPFAQIKAEMTGHDHDSLARAIEELKPTANGELAAKTAQKEAAADLKATQPAHADHDGDDQ